MKLVLGITAALASSDLCVNSGEASVGDCFWSNEVSQGISVSPKQLIFLNPFISFPQAPGVIPFKFGSKDVSEPSEDDVIYALIETDLFPIFDQPAPALEVTCVHSLFIRHHKLSESLFASHQHANRPRRLANL